MRNNFQRIGLSSNTEAGRKFENIAFDYFCNNNIKLHENYKIMIGVDEYKKVHRFDLGNEEYLIECKSMTWTESDKVPSAKLKNWNEAMYYFSLAPKEYKKIFFVEMSYSQSRIKTLLQYFIEKYYHLIPRDVMLYDYYTQGGNCDIYSVDSYMKKIKDQS